MGKSTYARGADWVGEKKKACLIGNSNPSKDQFRSIKIAVSAGERGRDKLRSKTNCEEEKGKRLK